MSERPRDFEAEIEEKLLGRPATMGRREISREAAVSVMSARKLWHALGFQIVDDEEIMFTEADLDALVRVSNLIRDSDLDEDMALAMARAFARTSDRLAVWQTQLVAEYLTPDEQEAEIGEKDARSVPDRGVAEASATLIVDLVDQLEPLMVYVWRRHLTSAITRMLADARDTDHDPSAPLRVVGFADLVNFTSLVRRMTERQLGTLVQRFEELASDVVTTHGGRVIKTVGDEVLFVHADANAAAAIGLDLVDAMGEDDLLPDVRVGMASGKVISRLGDVFGTTVNRASRLTAVTPPGRVFVDDEVARALGTLSGFSMIEQRRRHLRGIGTITPFELARSSGARKDRPWDQHA
ncbi:adenylate/guanylate cyclase domain-containing protein [Knoellia sp. Soil729]|uniref:adenylate/guanylate cyclase domain-containing protein n=1 Tax=Knoellia sp. Soil729 TaxID=1736394 RepID=UPI0006FEB632|nr:adenylate/guanylate cyclase domain-containing protein [Knoellia sp. Soil729]KRE43750.1 adenylyl cyclase [Knoellia sp. Soil729]